METEDEGKVQIAEFHRIDEKDIDLTTFQIWQSKEGSRKKPHQLKPVLRRVQKGPFLWASHSLPRPL